MKSVAKLASITLSNSSVVGFGLAIFDQRWCVPSWHLGPLRPPLSLNGGLSVSNFLAILFVACIAVFGLYITRKQN